MINSGPELDLDYEDLITPEAPEAPERRLLAAVLKCAILDAAGADPELATAAMEWLTDPSEDPMSVSWIVGELYESPDEVLAAIFDTLLSPPALDEVRRAFYRKFA